MPNSLLFVNACPRGEASRTLRLCRAFLRALDAPYREVSLDALALSPLDGASLAAREALIAREAWDDPSFAPARDYRDAEAVLIGAPYWDLSFPAALKVYAERLYVREMTFRYRNDRPAGLCRPRRALYVTTAGGKIGEADFGTDYMRAVTAMLGCPRFDAVRADGLDMEGAPVEAILAEAEAQLQEIAAEWQRSRF